MPPKGRCPGRWRPKLGYVDEKAVNALAVRVNQERECRDYLARFEEQDVKSIVLEEETWLGQQIQKYGRTMNIGGEAVKSTHQHLERYTRQLAEARRRALYPLTYPPVFASGSDWEVYRAVVISTLLDRIISPLQAIILEFARPVTFERNAFPAIGTEVVVMDKQAKFVRDPA